MVLEEKEKAKRDAVNQAFIKDLDIEKKPLANGYKPTANGHVMNGKAILVANGKTSHNADLTTLTPHDADVTPVVVPDVTMVHRNNSMNTLSRAVPAPPVTAVDPTSPKSGDRTSYTPSRDSVSVYSVGDVLSTADSMIMSEADKADPVYIDPEITGVYMNPKDFDMASSYRPEVIPSTAETVETLDATKLLRNEPDGAAYSSSNMTDSDLTPGDGTTEYYRYDPSLVDSNKTITDSNSTLVIPTPENAKFVPLEPQVIDEPIKRNALEQGSVDPPMKYREFNPEPVKEPISGSLPDLEDHVYEEPKVREPSPIIQSYSVGRSSMMDSGPSVTVIRL